LGKSKEIPIAAWPVADKKAAESNADIARSLIDAIMVAAEWSACP
jgi:hypothetical protein